MATTADRKIVLSDLAYALLGAGDALIGKARQLTESSDEIPEHIATRLSDAVDQLRKAVDEAVENMGTQAQKRAKEAEEGFDSLSDRGRALVQRLSRESDVTDAQADVEQARQGVVGALTSVRNATTQAVSKIKAAGTLTGDATESVATAATTAAKQVAGNRHDKPLTEHTKAELYELATARDIDGRSSMSKDQLVKALR